MNMFEKRTKFNMVTSAEDPKTAYAETPDNLRLIFSEGKYVGWYTPVLTKPLD